MTIPLVLAGVNHRTASVDLRERLAFAATDLTSALAELRGCPGVGEGLILSTCNRVEVLTFAESREPDLISFLSEHSGVPIRDLQPHTYFHRGAEAVQHVFRVAASLDSMVVGESQILGQLKEAYALARSCGCAQA